MNRFEAAIDLIDAANAVDPLGKELTYSRRMTAWLDRLEPQASESLKLAARAQHIRRWEIPRDSFPRDRRGYHLWRTTLYAFHAEKAGEIVKSVGYDEPIVARVQSLLRKERIKSDPEMQTLEDVICLVFLENYFADFAPQHDEAKVIGILQKTWKKMSERGQAEALRLTMPQEARRLVSKALS